MAEGMVSPRTEGTPQGGPLSPLLSNILLTELDMELERRGHAFCRYADDCNIYVKSRAAGERVMASITRFLSDTKVVESVSAETLMAHIQAHTRKGSVYYTDAFRGYQSLQRYGKHLVVNHSRDFVNKRTKNHFNGIEGFWSYAKHILYNYRGVSRYHFPMYLKEIEYRYNHRQENVCKLFLAIYFGYVSP